PLLVRRFDENAARLDLRQYGRRAARQERERDNGQNPPHEVLLKNQKAFPVEDTGKAALLAASPHLSSVCEVGIGTWSRVRAGCRGVIGPVPQPLSIRSAYSVVRRLYQNDEAMRSVIRRISGRRACLVRKVG